MFSESFVTRMMYVIEHFPFEPQLVGEEHWAQETKMELRRIREEVRILRAHIKQARLQAHTTDTKVSSVDLLLPTRTNFSQNTTNAVAAANIVPLAQVCWVWRVPFLGMQVC